LSRGVVIDFDLVLFVFVIASLIPPWPVGSASLDDDIRRATLSKVVE
jgi:hypothetical protein